MNRMMTGIKQYTAGPQCSAWLVFQPVRVHPQIHIIPGLIPGGVSLLFGSPLLPHEADIASIVLHMLLGVLQAECILGGL